MASVSLVTCRVREMINHGLMAPVLNKLSPAKIDSLNEL